MSIMELAIGWLAPPECIGCGVEGSSFCEGCLATEIIPFGERCYNCNKMSPGCRTCAGCRRSSPTYVWVSTDYENLPKDLVKLLKFRHQRTSASPITRAMIDTLLTFTSREDAQKYLVIPVPTATARVRERSFDHTALLANKIAKYLNIKSNNTLK